jgi:hypothetical protein
MEETSRYEEEQLNNGDTDSPSERSFLLPTALVVRSLSSESQVGRHVGLLETSCSKRSRRYVIIFGDVLHVQNLI